MGAAANVSIVAALNVGAAVVGAPDGRVVGAELGPRVVGAVVGDGVGAAEVGDGVGAAVRLRMWSRPLNE